MRPPSLLAGAPVTVALVFYLLFQGAIAVPQVLALCATEGFVTVAVTAILFGGDTYYAQGYSHWRWWQIRPGITTEQDLRTLLGQPAWLAWHYREEPSWPEPLAVVVFDQDMRVKYDVSATRRVSAVSRGDTEEEVRCTMGAPEEATWGYSGRSADGSYRQRTLRVRNSIVVSRHTDWYFD